MHRSVTLWSLAFLITAASAYYQRLTGPTYPVSGRITLGGDQISYTLARSHGGDSDAPVSVRAADTLVGGVMEWKRFNTQDPWTIVPLGRSGETLAASLPRQPAAGKLQYRVRLLKGGVSILLPSEEGVVLRFKGEVPLAVLIAHIVIIFSAMLFSTRAGLECFTAQPRYTGLALATFILMALGGMLLGPVVQKCAFDAYWTGWPLGVDLTDNKTLIALLAWMAAWIAARKVQNPKGWVIGAAIITFTVFLIPHSLLGSELKYDKPNAGQIQQTH
jgi:hypothetical protein